MSNVKIEYGADAAAITITITSLANAGQRQSTVVDNTTNKFLDALVQVKVKTHSSGTVGTGFVIVYAFGTSDIGTPSYPDGAGASDAGITLTSPPNMRPIGIINTVADSTTYISMPFSVAQAFGGVLPEKWGIVVENESGGALDASVGSAWYQGVFQTVA